MKHRQPETLLVFCLLFLFTSSCSLPLYEGTLQYVRTGGADLPVWVRGNLDSGVVIVLLHGGPGGTAFTYPALSAMRQLEESYTVVYWDQRLAGNNGGNAPESSLTFDNLAQDTRTIVEFVQARYQRANTPTKVFLLGHSWGGGLGTLALSDPAFQSRITGWIEVDGAHDTVHSDPLSRLWVIDYAKNYLATTPPGPDTDYWQQALRWLEARPVLQGSDFSVFLEQLGTAGAFGDTSAANGSTLELLLASPINLGVLQNSYVANHLTTTQWDFSSHLSSITIPTLLIWGALDGRVPAALAPATLEGLGTSPADKSSVILPHSGHSPMIDDPEGFLAAVTTFVEHYR